MRLMLLGCPGVGKGTQAKFITERFQIPQISTGDMLRQAVTSGSELGKKVKDIMDQGQLVPDDIMIELVKARIHQKDCEKGFILDGFPRTIPQADALEKQNITLDYIIELVLSDEEIIKRLSGRRVHPLSGRVYHLIYHPPKQPDKDDITGEPLIQRVDDHEDTVRKRLAIYHQQTRPLIDYYQQKSKQSSQKPQYIKINAEGTIEEITDKIFQILK